MGCILLFVGLIKVATNQLFVPYLLCRGSVRLKRCADFYGVVLRFRLVLHSFCSRFFSRFRFTVYAIPNNRKY